MKKKTNDQEITKEKDDKKVVDNVVNNPKSENCTDSKPDSASEADQSEHKTDTSNGSKTNTDNSLSEIKAVEEKLAEMQDKYLRLAAEFDNYRRRTLREKMDLSKYGNETLLSKILPLMDDFERALKHIDSTADNKSIRDGIEIIYSKFGEFLKQNSVKEIESFNCDFNVDLHEAVAKVSVEESEKKGKVIDVILKGYYLQDKVLRFAKVVVGE
jgi:molecular chaperone GrpE